MNKRYTLIFAIALIIISIGPLYAQKQQDIIFGLANKHANFSNYRLYDKSNWMNYFQVGYSHSLNKHFSVTGFLSFAQMAEDNTYLIGANTIASFTMLGTVLRWNALNLRHHALNLYLGPSLEYMSVMNSSYQKYFFFAEKDNPDVVVEVATLHDLKKFDDFPSLNIGTFGRPTVVLYAAAEYVFYPLRRLGIGATVRFPSHIFSRVIDFKDVWYQEASFGPVLHYRFSPEGSDYTSNGKDQFGLHILPTYSRRADRLGWQFQTQYQRQLNSRWKAGANLTYLKGSNYPGSYPAYAQHYYQYHATIASVQGSYQLYQQKKHQLHLAAGPAFYWGAYATPQGFYNARNQENTLVYDPAVQKGDAQYVGNYLQVEVQKHQSWGAASSLKYDYQLTDNLYAGGILNYQWYGDGEQLLGLGLQATVAF